MNRLLIDTNINSLALRGDENVVQNLQHTESISISVISLGELLSGFQGGDREEKNREELFKFLDSPRVILLYADEETADYYSLILDQLRKNGTPVPTNDIWIAATAMQHGLKVYTKDQHFNNIKAIGLL